MRSCGKPTHSLRLFLGKKRRDTSAATDTHGYTQIHTENGATECADNADPSVQTTESAARGGRVRVPPAPPAARGVRRSMDANAGRSMWRSHPWISSHLSCATARRTNPFTAGLDLSAASASLESANTFLCDISSPRSVRGVPRSPRLTTAGCRRRPRSPRLTTVGYPRRPRSRRLTTVGCPRRPRSPRLTTVGCPRRPRSPRLTTVGCPRRPRISAADTLIPEVRG